MNVYELLQCLLIKATGTLCLYRVTNRVTTRNMFVRIGFITSQSNVNVILIINEILTSVLC